MVNLITTNLLTLLLLFSVSSINCAPQHGNGGGGGVALLSSPHSVKAHVLSQHYAPSVYNSLGSIEDVDKLVTADQIRKLGEIIMRYGHDKDVLAIKAHRHFALAPTEAMLEQPKGTDGTSIARPATLETIRKQKATPNVIALGASTTAEAKPRWYPVNYELDGGGLSDGNAAWKDQHFLAAAATYLTQNGLGDKLMLGTAQSGREGQKFLESNDEKTRTSAMRPLPAGELMPEKTIETTYSFEKTVDGGGKMTVEANCQYYCVPKPNKGHDFGHYIPSKLLQT